jgi:ABC-type multidrug transport system permease subunit
MVTKKNYSLVAANFFRHLVVGAFYGSLYWHLSTGSTQNCYNNRLALIFFSVTFLVAGHQAIIPEILQNRLVFYRERGARAYGPIAYWASCWVIEIPLIVINVTVFSLTVVYMTQLRADFEAIVFFTAILVLNSIVGLFICHLIAAISPSSQAAVSLYPIFLFFSVAFGGFIVYIPQFPSWLGSWAPYGSFMRYSMQALVLNEFKDNPNLPLSEQYIDMLGFNGMTKEQCAPILLLFVGGFSLCFFLALRYVDFEVR